MSLSPDKIRTICEIVNVFETGKREGDYSAATVLPDGAGISYGRSQATDKSDSLDAIVFKYIERRGKYASEFRGYLDDLSEDATAHVDPGNLPNWVMDLLGLLIDAGEDPIMRTVQDEVFTQNYWVPAVNHCTSMGLTLPLSYAVIYDTCIHSGPGGVYKIRRLFPDVPPSLGGYEKKWTSAYIRARRAWLGSSSKPVVRKTVYRMDAFISLIERGAWELEPPFTVRNVKF